MTIPVAGIGEGVGHVIRAIADAAERDADDRAAAIGRKLMRLRVLLEKAEERERRRPGRGFAMVPAGGVLVRLGPDSIRDVIDGLVADRALWLERSG